MRVSVYFNVNKRCFSIRAEEGQEKGRVIAHADEVLLNEVTFRVSESGREKVRREGRKNVHAFVKGNLLGFTGPNAFATMPGLRTLCNTWFGGHWSDEIERQSNLITMCGKRFSYNPYLDDTFVIEREDRLEPLHDAGSAFLSKFKGRFVYLPNTE